MVASIKIYCICKHINVNEFCRPLFIRHCCRSFSSSPFRGLPFSPLPSPHSRRRRWSSSVPPSTRCRTPSNVEWETSNINNVQKIQRRTPLHVPHVQTLTCPTLTLPRCTQSRKFVNERLLFCTYSRPSFLTMFCFYAPSALVMPSYLYRYFQKYKIYYFSINLADTLAGTFSRPP